MISQLVVASKNEGKIREIEELLEDLHLTVLTFHDFGEWPDVEETGETYLENARLKAQALVHTTGLPALADDSGIEVDALGGAPGVRSARFSGPTATEDENNQKLIEMLDRVPEAERGARYRCVVVVAMPDGSELVGDGTCEGSIAFEPKGSGGFGYDPWFIPRGSGRTMAELDPDEKHAISHRGAALRQVVEALRAIVV